MALATACWFLYLHSEKRENKNKHVTSSKVLLNVCSSEYVKGLEIVCNMIMNKAAEVLSGCGRQ